MAVAAGCGFKRDATKGPMPAGSKLVQIDVDPGALNNLYPADVAVLGDAKAVLHQMVAMARDTLPEARLQPRPGVAERVQALKQRWLEICRPMLTSAQTPIEPFRITGEFSQLVDHDQTIVLHDAGGTRGYICQHYEATRPGGFIGYGVQSAMGWSLGAAMGAKVAAPDKLVAAFIGDEAFYETAIDLETSIVCNTPILVVLLNNRQDSLNGWTRWRGAGASTPRSARSGGRAAKISLRWRGRWAPSRSGSRTPSRSGPRWSGPSPPSTRGAPAWSSS